MARPAHDLVGLPFDDWRLEAQRRQVDRLLTIAVPGVVPDDATEVRTAGPVPIHLARGSYFFWDDGRWAALVVGQGPDSLTEPIEARHDRVEDDHPLAKARLVFDLIWAGATAIGIVGSLSPGQVVKLRGSSSIGEVIDHGRLREGTFLYQVRVEGSMKTVNESGLEIIDLEATDPAQWINGEPSSAADIAGRITLTKVTNALSDTLYSYGSSKTVIRPYQFKPVLRLIGSEHKRLLIADEVGLGKTIEAGLIWTELEQRADVRRVLVVCPAMLVRKWRDEMQRRFNRTVRVLDRVAMEELVQLFRTGESETPFYGVVSLERLRRSEQLEELESAGPTFDLVIVDEAHYLRNADTSSYELGERLSDWADALIFLSATPLNLGQDDLFNLVNLLLPTEFPSRDIFRAQLQPNAVLTEAGRMLSQRAPAPQGILAKLDDLRSLQFGAAVMARPEFVELTAILRRGALTSIDQARAKRLIADLNTLASAVTRTRRADVPDAKARREPINIEVPWTPGERAFYHEVWMWTWAKAHADGTPPGFAAQMPLRQTASCIPAMRMRLAELEADVRGDVADDVPDEVDLDSGGDEFSDPEEGVTWDDGLVDQVRGRVSAAAEAIGSVDTKFDAFERELRRSLSQGAGQAMVFSFFRRTLAYLAQRLEGQHRIGVMHGGVPVEERENLMARFRAGRIDVLLLSEVGSEGLDFEFCNVLFNYDLPWNPMRVEQRIGRLDRFGQTHEKIFIYNFQVPGTIETDIFDRLYRRLRVFEDSIGELEPILREEFAQVHRLVLDPTLSEEERAEEISRTEVAFASRADQLNELRTAEGELIGLDQLIVDGLERDIDRGRYVGRSELLGLVQALLASHQGASLRLDGEATGELIGTEDLATALIRSQRSRGASKFSLTELARLLADGEPIAVTLDPDVASRTDRELLSVRHPLVLTAIDYVDSTPGARAARFGHVTIRGEERGEYLVLVTLLEVSGLRPTLELWPIAIDLESGAISPSVGDLLMGAIARGEFDEGGPTDERSLRDPVLTLIDHAEDELLRLEAERIASNDALVAARITTVKAEFAHKIQRAQDTLARVQHQPTTRRIYEGRIRNLRTEEARRLVDLERGGELAASLNNVAVVRLTVR